MSSTDSPARVQGALGDGTLLTADLDGESGLLRRLTYVAHLSGKGDTEVNWWFDDYREVEGLAIRRIEGELVGAVVGIGEVGNG